MKTAYIVVFNSNSESLQLFKMLKNKSYNVNMIATPCTISAGCTRAIEFNEENLEDVLQEIKDKDIKIKNIYKRNVSKKGFHYALIKI